MKNLRKQLISIALPVMLQGLVVATINMADVFMIGRIGETEIAGVGLANQILFLMMLFSFGINGAGAIYITQYFGRKETNNIKKYLSLMYISTIILSGIFTLFALFLPRWTMELYTSDRSVIDVAVPYLQIVSLSFIFTALSIAYTTSLRCMENTKIAMYASSATLVINVVLNYLLIFGNFGFPKLGVEGAAIATTIARTFELIVIMGFAKLKDYSVFVGFRDIKKIDLSFVKSFYSRGLPVIGSHVAWSVGMTLLFSIYASVGTDALAVMNIVGAIERIAFIGVMGIGNSVGVIVGQELGRGQLEKAYETSKRLLKLNFMVGITVSLILILSATALMNFYNIDDELKKTGVRVIYVLAFFFPLSSINFTNMVGVLRAGGDVKRVLLIDLIGMWATALPMALIGAKMGLPIYIVYFMALSEQITKATFCLQRFFSKKWINTV